MSQLPGGISSLNAADLSQTSLPSPGRTQAKDLRHAAGEFESILLNQWLSGAESTFGSVPGSEDEEDAGDQQMKSFGVQALARGITAAGGIGLSALVSRALAEHTDAPGAASSPTRGNGT